MSKKWFTSDLHFSHKNIVKFTQRGKDTTQEEHDSWLIDLWNSQVAKGDLVYHLGDFSFSRDTEHACNIVELLHGQKIFIKGNHDDRTVLNWLAERKAIIKWKDYEEIKIGKQSVCLFHFPIASWHKQGHGSWHLHGHSHGNFLNPQGKMLDVGLDSAYNITGKHKFFSEEEITNWMSHREVYVADNHRSNV